MGVGCRGGVAAEAAAGMGTAATVVGAAAVPDDVFTSVVSATAGLDFSVPNSDVMATKDGPASSKIPLCFFMELLGCGRSGFPLPLLIFRVCNGYFVILSQYRIKQIRITVLTLCNHEAHTYNT